MAKPVKKKKRCVFVPGIQAGAVYPPMKRKPVDTRYSKASK
jgi:hypothetical protein